MKQQNEAGDITQCFLGHQTDRAVNKMTLNILTITLFYVLLAEGQESDGPQNLNQLPRTIHHNNYELGSSKDEYVWSIDFPDGGSRTEIVQLLTDEYGRKVPKVEGVLKLIYQDAPFVVTVMYQADEKGYRAKYVYGQVSNSLIPVRALSANVLKSAAG
ncbi:uncharacterized protein [Eurosta solidaginis]|uniref:uncharacterized protein n=1 Tax=Eurosta solidaginis TaxID=178769 RepID=UPI0035316B49